MLTVENDFLFHLEFQIIVAIIINKLSSFLNIWECLITWILLNKVY